MRSPPGIRHSALQWLGILLMLFVALRPMLELACDLHETAHGTHQADHEEHSLLADESGGMPERLHDFLHLGFCCGHVHLTPGSLFPV